MRQFFALLAFSAAAWLVAPACAADSAISREEQALEEIGRVATKRAERDALIAIALGMNRLYSYGGGGAPQPQEQLEQMWFEMEVSQRVMKTHGIVYEPRGAGCDPRDAASEYNYTKTFDAVMDAHLRRKLGPDYRKRIDDKIQAELAVARVPGR